MKKLFILLLLLIFLFTGLFSKKLYKEKTGRKDTKKITEIKKRNKRLGRATIEFFTLMGYWQTRYWIVYSDYIEDWQFEFTFKDQAKRLYTSEAYRMDSNCYSLNWLHSTAGAGFYTVARSNYYGWLKSLLFSTLGSAYWEYVVEWREVISFNDMIITPIGGLSLGEAMFQTSDHYNSKKGLLNQILSLIVSPISRINRWFDRNKSPILLDKTGWGKYDILFGYEKTSGTDSDTGNNKLFHFGFDNKMITIPEYGKKGEYKEHIKETIYSRLNIFLSYGKNGIEDFNIFTKAVFFGLFDQSIDKDGEGYSLTLGMGSRFDFYKKRAKSKFDSCEFEIDDGQSLELDEPREFSDKYTVVNISGPVFTYTFFKKSLRLQLNFEAYFDFALMNSFAINKYSEYFDISRVKTTLLYYGYYYAYGYTTEIGIEGEVKNFNFSGNLRYSAYRSIQGLDRFQDKITDDFLIKDIILNYYLELGYKIKNTPFELYISVRSRNRQGKIFSLSDKGSELKFITGFKLNI